MQTIAATAVVLWTVDFDVALVSATWSVAPSGGVTVTAESINTGTGQVVAKISGAGARVGDVYTVTCSAVPASGLVDPRVLTFRVADATVTL